MPRGKRGSAVVGKPDLMPGDDHTDPKQQGAGEENECPHKETDHGQEGEHETHFSTNLAELNIVFKN